MNDAHTEHGNGTIGLQVDDGVAVLTLDNPGRHNAIDLAMAVGLRRAAEELAARTDVGAIVLRGAGERAFCAGMDVKYASATGNRDAAIAAMDTHVHAFLEGLQSLGIPSVALVHGVCFGGGVHLATSMDFRWADAQLRWCVPAVRNRLIYPLDAIERLRALSGPQRAARLLLAGETLDAPTAHAWGLVDQVEPADRLMQATLDFARQLADQPREVVRAYGRIFRALDAGDRPAAAAWREQARAQLRQAAEGGAA